MQRERPGKAQSAMTSGAAQRSDPVTETSRPEWADLDARPTRAIVELMNDEDARVAEAVRRTAPELAAAIDAIVERLRVGGRLVYAGAGTSGRLALVDAAECGPTFGIDERTVVALVAGGATAAATAQEAAEDDAAAGAADVAALAVNAADAVVVLSASGRTPYALGAARAAREAGALLVAVVCAEDAPLAEGADHTVAAVVGPEVVAGSTRLKAGTAQKLILNTISTVSMVKLGRTYGNLMVDVIASNAKLRTRARRAVELATGASAEEAEAALDAAGGAAKVAIVALLTGDDAVRAGARLDGAGGSVRRALEP
jgi:N-acetylmuramic acid 6-phosphate etherase